MLVCVCVWLRARTCVRACFCIGVRARVREEGGRDRVYVCVCARLRACVGGCMRVAGWVYECV